jgi:hypothetical protein
MKNSFKKYIQIKNSACDLTFKNMLFENKLFLKMNLNPTGVLIDKTVNQN